MRFLLALTFLIAPLHASASPACMEKVQTAYLECHTACGQLDGASSIDCIRGCAISYNIGKRNCQLGGLGFSPEALISHCKAIVADDDGNTFVCTSDGKRYVSRAWCQASCK